MEKRQRQPLPLTELTAITILDGRNRADVLELAPYVSEFGIIKTRVEVEAKYLVALSDVGVVRPLTPVEKRKLLSFGERVSLSDAKKIKKIEEETDHDVKAMERAFRTMLSGTSMEDLTEKVHFGLTSEDVNNITYRLILRRVTQDVSIPALDGLLDDLLEDAKAYKETPMLARTHGQAAVPTTLGHEIAVFARRLNRQMRQLEEYPLEAKLTGAVGNLSALHDSYPDIDWISFAQNFIRSFGFDPNLITTQTAPYEDMIEYFQHYSRINNILLDFDQDVWRYISDHWFAQELKKGEVGSSTMPQKVNPIKFENSEGNLGKANAIFEFFTRKLPVSRLSRDLSDSTVVREMGAPLGWSLLAYKNTRRGLARVFPNIKLIAQALNEDWSILSEAAQTRMRKYGVDDPYSIMKNLTQGKHIGKEEWIRIVEQLPLTDGQKEDLKRLTPEAYIGLAVELTEKTIGEIESSRKK
ncbi:adenylosuccinate lyase [Patescibacteria group bacterium]|nr:adenylosuccinate lyase [Patescibacteria group bacterium]